MTSKASKPKTSTLFDPLTRQVGALRRERAELEEEVRQLRAAVQIWTEVHRQTISEATDPETRNAEMQ